MEVSCQQPPAKEEEAEILGVMTPIYCPSCGKNLVIIAVMLVLGIGGASLGLGPVVFSGIGLAALAGLILNGVFLATKATEE